ncbi:MAG: hypothetical protein V3W41_14020, partial [Planctomycetota bacterium]
NDLPVPIEFRIGAISAHVEPGGMQTLQGLARGETEMSAYDREGNLLEQTTIELGGPDLVQVYAVLGATPLVVRVIDVKADGTRSYENEAVIRHGRPAIQFNAFDLVLPPSDQIDGLVAGRYRVLDRQSGGWAAALAEQLNQRTSMEVASVARKIASLPGLDGDDRLRTLDFVAFAESPKVAGRFGFELAGEFPAEAEFRREVLRLRQSHDDRARLICDYETRHREGLSDALSCELLVKVLGPREGTAVLSQGLESYPASSAIQLLAGMAAHFAKDFDRSDKHLAKVHDLGAEAASAATELRFRNGFRLGQPRSAAGAFVKALSTHKEGEFARLFLIWERVRERADFPPNLADLHALMTSLLGEEPSEGLYRALLVATRPAEFSADQLANYEPVSMRKTLLLRLKLEEGGGGAAGLAASKAAVQKESDDVLGRLDDEARAFTVGLLLATGEKVRAVALLVSLDDETRRVMIPYLEESNDLVIDDTWLLPERRALLRFLRAELFLTGENQPELRRALRKRASEDDLLGGLAARFMARQG